VCMRTRVSMDIPARLIAGSLMHRVACAHARPCARDIGQDYFAVYRERSFNSIPRAYIDRAQAASAIISPTIVRARAQSAIRTVLIAPDRRLTATSPGRCSVANIYSSSPSSSSSSSSRGACPVFCPVCLFPCDVDVHQLSRRFLPAGYHPFCLRSSLDSGPSRDISDPAERCQRCTLSLSFPLFLVDSWRWLFPLLLQ